MKAEAAVSDQSVLLCAPQLQLIRVDKIASATINLNLPEEMYVAPPVEPKVGDVVVVRTLTDSATYNQLELTSGRLARINPHDIIVGVLGRRRALKGFVGDVPTELQLGDRLHILNLGGVIGRCTGHHHAVGRPIEVELLGAAWRNGCAFNIAQRAIRPATRLRQSAPLVLVAGTCMGSGKTEAAADLIKHFTRCGYRVAAGKLSGIACLRDTLNMQDHGAIKTLSFLDCGYPSTVGLDDIAPIAKAIVTNLTKVEPDVIVLECGDGILGGYQVESVFHDAEVMRFCAALVFCAGDFVGAWGGLHFLQQQGIRIDVISGAATDSRMGIEYIEREFGVPAANALNGGEDLFELVREKVEAWKKSK
jgi:hypothetical protein